ncbi:probable RNA-directed DNA polymerase from transposon X-element [Nephila pilipes]|uniref:Probable RNA-directed DNA polymerase from transposon X-element n=1 Tax=Nephila pilipes TaxID=299642 RepID=A0A8X6IN51_NEPPI|nr:probable RNA-directed DNA polymerase from transposon X-element [Nephila pilipes]
MDSAPSSSEMERENENGEKKSPASQEVFNIVNIGYLRVKIEAVKISQRPLESYRQATPQISYSQILSGQTTVHPAPVQNSTASPSSGNFGEIFRAVMAIASDANVDEQLFARAFRESRARLPRPTPTLKFNRDVHDISLGFWNANGLRSKIDEVRDFVTEQNFDLFLVQETKLQAGHEPQIANYRLHKDDRTPRIDGGTAIYCKSNYEHCRVLLPRLQYIDATAIEIKINNYPPLRIISAYIRNTPLNRCLFPEEDFIKLINSSQNVIIVGDMNARHKDWHDSRSNTFGFKLKNIISRTTGARVVAPYTPTHINPRSRPGARDSIIGLAIFKNIPFNYDIRVIHDLSSDHLPVILTLNTNSTFLKLPEQLSTNWENFKFILNSNPLPIPNTSSNEDIENSIEQIGVTISEALVTASKPKFKPPPLRLPIEIRNKIRRKNYVRRVWQRCRNPALKSELRALSNEIKREIQHFSQERWGKHIEGLSPDTNTLWRETPRLKKPFHTIPPLKGALGSVSVAPILWVEVIADSLQKQFEPNEGENPRFSAHTTRKVQGFLASPTCLEDRRGGPHSQAPFR